MRRWKVSAWAESYPGYAPLEPLGTGDWVRYDDVEALEVKIVRLETAAVAAERDAASAEGFIRALNDQAARQEEVIDGLREELADLKARAPKGDM